MSDDDGVEAHPRWERPDGRTRVLVAADGTPLVRVEGEASSPRWVLRLPDHREIAVLPGAADHPVLGRSDVVLGPSGEPLACGSAVDWERPDHVPALDRPGALPPGAGTALLNLLAGQARRAGLPALRYRGPYPSEALWTTLQASFRVDDPEAARERFLAGAETKALAGRSIEIDVDFVPAPHAWTWPTPRICVQRRAGIERVYVDGRAFDRDGLGPRILRRDGDELVATVSIGLRPWHEVLRLSSRGEPRGEPHPLPPPPEDLLDTPLSEPVVAVLAEVIVAQAPAALQPALRRTLDGLPIVWSDLGDELVRARPDRLELHAALVTALPTEATPLLGSLLQLLEAPARRLAAASLLRTFDATVDDWLAWRRITSPRDRL